MAPKKQASTAAENKKQSKQSKYVLPNVSPAATRSRQSHLVRDEAPDDVALPSRLPVPENQPQHQPSGPSPGQVRTQTPPPAPSQLELAPPQLEPEPELAQLPQQVHADRGNEDENEDVNVDPHIAKKPRGRPKGFKLSPVCLSALRIQGYVK